SGRSCGYGPKPSRRWAEHSPTPVSMTSSSRTDRCRSPSSARWSTAGSSERERTRQVSAGSDSVRTMPDVTSELASPAWLVEPSGPLRGDVTVAGSKNAVTKHMVAAVMGSTPSVIENIPDVGDVHITEAILRSLGVGVERSGDRIEIHPAAEVGSQVSVEYT